MKKSKVLIGCLTLAALFTGVVSCGKTDEQPVEPVKDKYSIKLTSNANVSIKVGESSNISFEMYKNDKVDSNLDFEFEVSNDSVIFNKDTKKVTANKEGEATLTLWIKDHKDAGTISINFKVEKNVYLIKLTSNNSLKIETGATSVVSFEMYKNEILDNELDFEFEVSNDSITFDKETKAITGSKVGDASLNLWIKDHKDSGIITVNVNVIEALFDVSGGVIKESDGTLVFPEEKNSVNGVGNETAYEENEYSAKLKKTVKGDFDLEFKVSDYKVKEGVAYPKLMISLGGSHNQFYVAYKPNGEYRVETFTNFINSTENYSYNYGGAWVNSNNFENFDTNAEHTYKISVEGGLYHLYMDGNELSMNLDGTTKLIARSFSDYTSELPVRISTNGVSAKVSDIKVTQKESSKAFYYLNDTYIKDVTTNGFKLIAAQGGWNNKDQDINRISLLKKVDNNVALTFKLKASKTMTDGKFMAELGGNIVMVNYKNDVISCNINGIGHDWDDVAANGATYNELTVKIIRNEGNIKAYINDIELRNYDNAQSGDYVKFSIFNEAEADKDVTIELSDLSIGNI